MVRRSSEEGHPALIDLRQLAQELYYTARAFRIFTMRRRAVSSDRALTLLSLTADELRSKLSRNEALLE
jgi:hypothetical protein